MTRRFIYVLGRVVFFAALGTAAPLPLSAQRVLPRTAEVTGRAPAVKRLLSTVGHWSATDDTGTFYLQFRANGTYTYTHIDSSKVTRAQQAGHFDVRIARLADERWPGVSAPDADARRNRGFELVVAPSAIEVEASDPQGLPDDSPGQFRLTLTLPASAGDEPPRVTLLSTTLPPDSTFGRLTFAPGP